MRFTITALGAFGGRTVDDVVDSIVRYLDRPRPVPGPTAPPGDAPSSYYADSGEEPGRWLGTGAENAGLAGEVTAEDFGRVLAGRDPRTGERLLGAQGSAGRRPTLGVGAQTRSLDGERVYDERDAAAALRIDADELDRLLVAGLAAAITALAGRRRPPARTAYLVPVIDGNGERWVSEREIARLERARAEGITPEDVMAAGGRDDLLSITDAALLAGVTTRYLRGLARRWERERRSIEAELAGGREARRAYLVAYRGPKNRWQVKRADLADYVTRRRPPAVRVGFDLTLTTEKSLGVLALLGDDASRHAVLDAIRTGNDTALRWWENRSAVARTHGERTPALGWTAASFRHLTSRALDPFPHHHNVVANSVVLPNGQRRTLDSKSLYRHAVGASAIATAEMRYQLTAALGVTWRPSAHGGWEIEGIPADVLRAFSQRQTEIDDALAELEDAIGRTSTIGELRNVAATTRPPKQQADASDLRADWWRRAQSLGFTPDHLRATVGLGDRRIDDVPAEAICRQLAAPDGICSGGSVFTRGDVLAAIVDLPMQTADGVQPPMLSADDLERVADRFLESPLVVQLELEAGKRRGRLADEPVFTTREMLTIQHRIVHRFELPSPPHAAVQPESVHAACASAGLSDEQTELVTSLCVSGRRVQCAIGRAGSGKTTAMRAAAQAWKATGYRVIGTAVKGEAARLLGKEAGIPAETLAWILAHDDPRYHPLDARTVLIVDEASTVSDRDLDLLLEHAERAGAVVRLVGDPAQHGSVAAGGMFRALCEAHPELTPELRESRRLRHLGDRTAVDALRAGDVAGALDALHDAGHLHLAANDAELYARLLTRWWTERQAGRPHPLVERSNHRRTQLNRLARRLLQSQGTVASDEIEASGSRAFSVGDEVMARRGNRDLHPDGNPDAYVRNGARGVVTGITRGTTPDSDAITITFDAGPVVVPRSFFDAHPGRKGRMEVGIDHAYAVTSYAVQGATFDSSTSRIDERATRAETYVDITRGREANHLFVTRADDPLDGERLPKAPDPPLDVSIAIRLSASTGEVTAWELDPHALARTRRGVQPLSLT